MYDAAFNVSVIIVILFSILWGYAFLSTIVDDFYDNKNKILWILLLIFLPVTAVLFPFIATKQMPNGMANFKKGIYSSVIAITGFLIFVIVITGVVVYLSKSST